MCFRESEKRVGFMRLHYAHPGPTRTRKPRASSSHGRPSATPQLLARNIKASTWGRTTHRADTCLCSTHHVLAICLMFNQKLLQINRPTRGKLQQIAIKMNVPAII